MKILVYGSGVIGSYLAHVLCIAGNDVTMLARGSWKEQLKKNGLWINHHLQRKETLNFPRVIGDIKEDDTYDAVFAVMPYNKMGAILGSLAKLQTPLVILVGNNISPAAMQQKILDNTVCDKQVLFGFQATAGKRDKESGILTCERAGAGTMDIGCLHGEPDDEIKASLEEAFGDTGYRLHWQPDMEAYLIFHLAAILPIGYLAYACDGDMTSATAFQRRLMRLASRDAFGMLKSQGIPILPDANEKYYMPGIRGSVMKLVYYVMTRNKMIGDLIACEHCRNAYEEMQMLDEAFAKIIARTPYYPMPHWAALKAQMPDWETVRRQYSTKNKKLQKVIRLTDEEIGEISSAYANYRYSNGEVGMTMFYKDRDTVYRYICGFVRAMIKNGSLYATPGHEAFVAYYASEDSVKLRAAGILFKTFAKEMGWNGIREYLSRTGAAGESLEKALKKAKRNYLYVALVAVTENHQGQGFMRQVLKAAFDEGHKRHCPVILETDDSLKRAKYEHLGMTTDRIRKLADDSYLYDLIWEADVTRAVTPDGVE